MIRRLLLISVFSFIFVMSAGYLTMAQEEASTQKAVVEAEGTFSAYG